MKQRDLLFAGLLLLAIPAFAQEERKPTLNPATDPKVIFEQGFEADWDTWSTTEIDRIQSMDYYLYNPDPKDNQNTHYYESEWDKWNERWVTTVNRSDTSFVLYKGNVVVTDDPQQLKDIEDNKPGNKFGRDTYTITTDEEQDRATFFGSYGQNGGSKVFFYHADSSSTSKKSDEYRRNLFVRLDPGTIEKNTSYRLSFFVRADTVLAKPWNSMIQVSSGVYRGYFHSEKPFTMGYINKPENNEFNTKFEFTTDDGDGTVHLENGQWKKVDYMTYYISDSIADRFYMGNYYWCNDGEWGTTYGIGMQGNSQSTKPLRYVKQPDKFFVRMSFRGDMTDYKFDNLSLTKSWIAGANYNGNILRIDFGYKTNIKDLAKAAKKAGAPTAAVRVPYSLEEDNFVVFGLPKGKEDVADNYKEIYIRSAEYHGDGYLYMFTDVEYYDGNGDPQLFNFDDYSKVLISFKNPKGENQLKYTGDGTRVSEAFPMADNKAWIQGGKVVPDLVNELGTPVPAETFTGVFSMENLPPALLKDGYPYPDNSFGLTAQDEFKFGFSRKLFIDNAGEASERVKVTVNGTTWNVALDHTQNDTVLIVSKPSGAPALSGDVEFHFMQLWGANDGNTATITDKADDIYVHYNFGSINRDLSSVVSPEVWNSNFLDSGNKSTETPGTVVSPKGVAAYWDSGSWWASMTFQEFDGQSDVNSLRIYRYTTAGLKHSVAICACPRNKPNTPLRVFLGYGTGFEINLGAGNYSLNYAAAPINKVSGFKVYVYPYQKDPLTIDPDEIVEVADHSSYGDKFWVEGDIRDDVTHNVDTILVSEFNDGFTIATAGRYIIEMRVNGADGGYNGKYPSTLFSNFTLVKTPISYGPINALNSAVAAAQGRVAQATGDKYVCSALTAVNGLIDQYKVESSFTSTDPSVWTDAAKVVSDATAVLKVRMDSVDLVVKKQGEVTKKLADVLADSSEYAKAEAYKTLKATSDAEFVFSQKNNVELGEYIKTMDDQIKALDARVASNKEFATALDTAQKLVAANSTQTIYEYKRLKDICEELATGTYDPFTALDAELADNVSLLIDATYDLNLSLVEKDVVTRRVLALKAISESDLLKSAITVNNEENVKGSLDTLRKDNDQLANVYKAAIKAAIYEKAAANDTIDLTPFIKNYYFYTTPRVIEMTDKQQPQNRNDFEYKKENHGAANVAHTKHQYGSNPPIWIVLTGNDWTNIVPGWTMKAVHKGSGNEEISTDICPTTDDGLVSFPNYKENKLIFDGAISMDWDGQAILTQEVVGLPAGIYELGLEVRNLYKYEKRKGSDMGTSTITVSREGVQDTSISFKTGYFRGEADVDSVVRPDRSDPTKIDTLRGDALNGFVNDTTFIHTMGKIAIGEDGKMTIKADLQTHSGSATFDNFSLKFTKDPNFDYAGALADAKAEVTEALTIVKAIDAVAENVEYYTLSGIKLAAPRMGEILIRKTTNANGKVVVDKVIIK